MRHLVVIITLVIAIVLVGCGSYDDYAFQYEGGADVPEVVAGEPWVGDERVILVLGAEKKEVPLAGITSTSFRGAPAVFLTDVVLAAALEEAPEDFRYDFTASDGYNLFVKRYEDASLLPSWDDMHHGFLYRNPDGDLRIGWDEDFQPWGSAVSAYRLKYMNGGTIALILSPVSDA